MCSFPQPWSWASCWMCYSHLSQQPQLLSAANDGTNSPEGRAGRVTSALGKNVICFSWKVQNPQRQPRPWPRLMSPAQRARRAGAQFCSPAAPAPWASPSPAHRMLSLDATSWAFKLAPPLQQVLALLFCSLTLGLQVWLYRIASKNLSFFQLH